MNVGLLAVAGATRPSVVLVERRITGRATSRASVLTSTLPMAAAEIEEGAGIRLG